jgi:predicted nucleotidyltransferase component of viral defense system
LEQKSILDDYTDKEALYEVKVYSLEESLAEKLRCVLQRSIPRDIYDIWYLTEQAGIDIEDVAFGFQDKSIHKDKDPLTLIDILNKKEKKYKADWEKSLKHQINDLPEFDGLWRGILAQVKSLIALLNS